jgi:hypothetical protein
MTLAFAGPLKDTSIYSKQPSIRFVGSDAAIAVTESGILFPGQAEVPDEGKVNLTWLVEKRDGHLLIAAYHNSPVLAPDNDSFLVKKTAPGVMPRGQDLNLRTLGYEQTTPRLLRLLDIDHLSIGKRDIGGAARPTGDWWPHGTRRRVRRPTVRE